MEETDHFICIDKETAADGRGRERRGGEGGGHSELIYILIRRDRCCAGNDRATIAGDAGGPIPPL